MKNNFFYFAASFLLIFTSCSNEAETKPIVPEKVVMPKTITYKVENNKNDQNNTIVYNGNKISSTSCFTYGRLMKTIFTYTGNLITKAQAYTDDELFSTTLYKYENGKIKEMIFLPENNNIANDFFRKLVYSHNTDGTISCKTYRSNTTEIPQDGVKILTFKNGNLIKVTAKYTDNPPNYTYVYEYKYDTKNNPLKNILGLDLILLDEGILSGHDITYGDMGIIDFGLNNIIEKTTRISDPEQNENVSVETWDYSYDANGYPLQKSSYFKINEVNVLNNIIEYTY